MSWKYVSVSIRTVAAVASFPRRAFLPPFLISPVLVAPSTQPAHATTPCRGFSMRRKISHNYAVLTRAGQVTHVIPCFLVRVTFPLDATSDSLLAHPYDRVTRARHVCTRAQPSPIRILRSRRRAACIQGAAEEMGQTGRR